LRKRGKSGNAEFIIVAANPVRELRDPDEARRYLLQGLWWQRATAPVAASVRPALALAYEVAASGQPLAPIGFLADVANVALGVGDVGQAAGELRSLPGVAANLLRTYEDHVLGKLYVDWTFERAADALRRYEDKDRNRGLAFLLDRFRERAGLPGVDLSPGIIKFLLDSPPEATLAEGWDSLTRDGPQPLLLEMYQALPAATRRVAEILGPEDVFELEHRTALNEPGERLALRQVLQAASGMEATLPRHPMRRSTRLARVPTRVLEEDTYPVGGFASLSTRGSIESLLHSQLAYMEPEGERPDLFDIKFLRDELLYYSRDSNQFLRRRRTFVFTLSADLEVTRCKDPELPFQRGVLLLAMLLVTVRRITDWLSTDALTFEFVFTGPDDKELALGAAERALGAASARRESPDPAATPGVAERALGAGLLTPPLAAERALLETLFRESIANGVVHLRQLSETELIDHCKEWTRRSLCHCLVIGTDPRPLNIADVTVTRLQVNGPRPAIGDGDDPPITPEAADAAESWNGALEQLLDRWVWSEQ
jgi:hypothetical protein